MKLKYGTNPNQEISSITLAGGELPIRALNGTPGYINLLDALNGWQLVRELKKALELPAAASFKHTSPAGAAVGIALTREQRRAYMVTQNEVSPLCAAYIRARGADRLSSFGDFVALSDICDLSTATYIQKEVSDGIIAPGYDNDALELLKTKRKGSYIILQIDDGFSPEENAPEERQIFGLTLMQQRNDAQITADILKNIVTAKKEFTSDALRDALLGLITLKYTQSNSVCYTYDGQTIGVGAGQQSRIHCTRLAGDKADIWRLRMHPKTLGLDFREGLSRPMRDNAIDAYVTGAELSAECFSTMPEPLTDAEKKEWLSLPSGVTLSSDGFFPFSDNIDRAAKSGVMYIAEPGGSVRDSEIIACCDKYGIAMAFTGIRLFYH